MYWWLLPPSEARCVQSDDHLLLKVVGEHTVVGKQLVLSEDGLLRVFASPSDSLWKVIPYG